LTRKTGFCSLKIDQGVQPNLRGLIHLQGDEVHTMAMYAKVRRMKFRDGLSISEIARRTSLSRNTIKTWLKEPVRSEMRTAARRPKKLDEFVRVAAQALETDARRPRKERRTALRLFEQLREEGFAGQLRRVTEFIRAWRAEAGAVTARSAYVPLELRVGRGVPVRLERGRHRDRRGLAQGAVGAHEAVRLASVLAGGVPEPGPRDAVRRSHALPAGWAAWPGAGSTTT
jgi:transposase